ncbi:AAA family ATPase [Candidatus Nitronereus thalassa]|uniref:AAA family ATPase n=1 Tax=Candidatus Nitronereus thalassa TaxID=3020898 RepID=A0ABU3K369_9BACT|nr:AAA family ATPase [Candidatus Nitronereus thalassa]MDT7040836.1 AAA family ATPase [Candidatus Nitronereus thalassa]
MDGRIMSGLYTPEIELVLEQGRKLLDQRSAEGRALSYGKIAKDLGMSAASVSNFFNRKQVGDVKKLADLLKHFIERERARDEASLLTVPFTDTRQAKKMMQALQFAHQYHRLVAVVSPPGTGKSTTVQEAQRRDPSIVRVHAANFFGPTATLQEMCEELREPQTGTSRALMKRIRAKLKGTGRLLVIDDAHKLRPNALDTVQTVYDQTGIGIVLFGTRELKRILTAIDERSEQMASRVAGRIWEIPEVDRNDLALILGAVMPEDHVEEALHLLEDDPSTLTSPRRLGNVIEIAGRLAQKHKGALGLTHIRQAMKLSA